MSTEMDMDLELENSMVRPENTPYDESQIQVLEGLEAVRKRPGMYIGSTGPRGLHHLVYEIVDNSIDEALAGYCTHIEVDVLPGNIVSVRDNGRGIPVGMNEKLGIPTVTVVLTVLHAAASSGAAATRCPAACTAWAPRWSTPCPPGWRWRSPGTARCMPSASNGALPVSELTVIGASDHDGTLIRFQADPEIFTETTEYEFEVLQKRLREQAFLNAGLSIRLTDTRDPELVQSETYCYEGGISSFVDFMIKTRGYQVLHPDVIHMSVSDGDSIAEVALQYNDSYNENIVSFANNIHTVDGGVHETAFKTAITRIFNDYARKHGCLRTTTPP